MPAPQYQKISLSFQQVDFEKVAQYLLVSMLRNVSSTGYAFTDPWYPSVESAPGCIIASPSFNITRDDNVTIEDDPNVRQNYIFNWTRDAAAVITEVASAGWSFLPCVGPNIFDDYVGFAALCQQNQDLSMACYRIDGKMRDRPVWTHQNDGPALQTLAVMAIWDQLSSSGKTVGLAVADANVEWLLDSEHYKTACFSPWEERQGECFFALAAILKCLKAVQGNAIGITQPAGITDAVGWLSDRIAAHWSEPFGCYVSVGTSFASGDYDPNADIVLAAIYGAIEATDEKLLSSAAKLRAVWAVPPAGAAPATTYQVNIGDWANGRGPLMGRYPSDRYDGDLDPQNAIGHPWPLCTSAFAELYYRVADAIRLAGAVTMTPLSAEFFAQVGVDASTSPQDAIGKLQTAGDQMLSAILYHSDHLELSEQFDAQSGFEKSVQNLTWSYASFLSALRARVALAS